MYQKDDNRRNVFKLSGNMALGGALPDYSGGSYKGIGRPSEYSTEDISAAKNSLQLLKAKQQAKRAEEMLASDSRGGYQPTSLNSYSNSKNNYEREMPQQNSYDKRPDMRRQQPASEDYSYGGSYQNSYGNYGKSSTTQHQQRGKATMDYGMSQQAQQGSRQPPRQPPMQSQPKEKPINQLKKEQKLQIQEYDPSELVECSAGCGRKFNPDSIDKHEKICQKVFQSKRKEFNTQAQRVVAKQQLKLMKKGAIVDQKIQQMKANQKMPKWKAESQALRAVARAKGGGQQKMASKQDRQAEKEAAGYLKCPHCGRMFNEKAGQRHIPFCAEQSKKNAIKKKK